MGFSESGRRHQAGKHVLAAGVLAIMLSCGTVLTFAQTGSGDDAQKARRDTEQAVESRQATQEQQDRWAEQKADLAARFRAANASVKWLGDRRAEETAEADALDERVTELIRRLEEADRLEGSMQDTLMVVFHRLEESVAASLPFLPTEREQRLAFVGKELVRPDVTSAEKLRHLLEALQVEAGYASTVEVYQDKVVVEGDELHADVLRMGRVALFWRTPDGERVGHFDPSTNNWTELPGGDKRRIELAMEMASRMRPVELVDLPLGRIGQ